MKNIFIDTGAFIAIRVSDDTNHKHAHNCLKLIQKQKLVLHTTNFILDEVYTYFCKHHAIAIEMAELILNNPLLNLHRISAEDEQNALKILKRFSDKAFSYTDATSFSIMERLKLKTAFTFDQHFIQYGKFEVL